MTITNLIKSTIFSAIAVSSLPLSAQAATSVGGVQTSAERAHDILGENTLTLPAPIKRWDNALPLGNGITGGLLWGEGREIRLSLDRGDLWDERGNKNVYDPKRNFATLLKSVQQKDHATWNKYFNATYNGSKWTKIPGARLGMTLPEGVTAKSFTLNFDHALGSIAVSKGDDIKAFFSATHPVALIKLPKGTHFKLVRPKSIDRLGYPAPETIEKSGEVSFVQKTAEDLVYAFTVQWKSVDDGILAAISITTNTKTKEPLALARQRAASAIADGWENLYQAHCAWWKDFYHSSDVKIPNPRLQHHYNLVKYYYGASSRAHASPMPLQGIWTADAGSLPPWKGDYHNDLNTQMTYIAWQAAGLKDAGMSYINYYENRLPQFRKYGKNFFGTKGAMIPGVMTHAGQPMGGWAQYAMSLTVGLWNGHAFYQYWKISNDTEFLKTRAYPWLSEVATSVFSLCEEKNGKLYLPLSSSPEWNDNRWNAYLKSNSNFDQALLTWAAGALEEMANALGKSDEAKKWATIKAKLPPLLIDKQSGALSIAAGETFNASHRHFSHTLAIHPLGIINVEQSPESKKLIQQSVRQIIDQGSRAWVGYSFTWAASLAARAGFANDAERLLVDFERAFVSRNGFHQNGDQTKTGLSGFKYRAFTLEGNFLLMDAIHEMYLQSWGGKIRIFPTVPEKWKDCAFTDLRAEGGFKVSATRKDGRTVKVVISSSTGGKFQLVNPFANAAYTTTKPLSKNHNHLLSTKLAPGEKITLIRK